MFSWLLIILAVPLVLLGAHGMNSFFHRWDLLSDVHYEQLFFSIHVPSQASGIVEWMSGKGYESLLVPAMFLGFGLFFAWNAYTRGLRIPLPGSVSRSSREGTGDDFDGIPKKIPSTSNQIWWKVSLSLGVLIDLVFAVWYGDRLYSHQIEPSVGYILFIILSLLFIILVWYLRKRYIRYQPSFTAIAFVMVTVTVILAFAGVGPFQNIHNDDDVSIDVQDNDATGDDTMMSFHIDGITWEVALESFNCSGGTIHTTLTVTNRGTFPADFPYGSIDPLPVVIEFGAVDSFGVWYDNANNMSYDFKRIYPGESRSYSPSFAVNPRSITVALYVTRYTGMLKIPLFELQTTQK